MHNNFLPAFLAVIVLLGAAAPARVMGDELTQRIQRDLVALGYDPGNIQGESTDATVAAIAQFQAERDMPVTGTVSPLLAGVISAAVSKQRGGATSAPAASAPAAAPDASLQAARQACLQKKMEEAEAANKKKRGLGRLMNAVTRTVGQTGNYDLARKTNEIYAASATIDDLSAAAKDLGLTDDDVTACQNP